jgi:4'-phosphopantetheinyl transferase
MHQALSLPRNSVHIWLLDPSTITDSALLDTYHQLLTPDEQERWVRYRFDKDKHQHLVTRALLRHTLSLYVPEVAPAGWRFVNNDYGKPSIANAVALPLQFNLSHTLNRVALAVTLEREIGVDVERIKPLDQVRGLAERCFTEEENHYIFGGDMRSHLTGDIQDVLWRFFKLWTLKEAYIKACGRGMSISLQSLSFDPQAAPLRLCFTDGYEDDSERWSFRVWQPGPQHLLSLAVSQPQSEPLDVGFYQAVPLRDFTPISMAEVITR